MSIKLIRFDVVVLFIVLHYARTWDYSNPDTDWPQPYSKCKGKMQSPIALDFYQATYVKKPLYYLNYNVQLKDSLTIHNNGHTVHLTIPTTIIGKRPQIYGGYLQGRFEAVSLHFHWGGPALNGSEHCINGQQYDAELHILHKNSKYNSLDNAMGKSDGIAVLAFMLQRHEYAVAPVGLQRILRSVPAIHKYNTYATIETFSLRQVLENLPTDKFYTYKGSLTTPECHENVTWHVFEEPIYVGYTDITRFFNLQDAKSQTLHGNYRPIQPLNERNIYFVTKSIYN